MRSRPELNRHACALPARARRTAETGRRAVAAPPSRPKAERRRSRPSARLGGFRGGTAAAFALLPTATVYAHGRRSAGRIAVFADSFPPTRQATDPASISLESQTPRKSVTRKEAGRTGWFVGLRDSGARVGGRVENGRIRVTGQPLASADASSVCGTLFGRSGPGRTRRRRSGSWPTKPAGRTTARRPSALRRHCRAPPARSTS